MIVIDLFREIPKALHRRADRNRTEAYGHAEEWRRQGFPERWIESQSRLPLALADLLDAVAGQRKGVEGG